MLPNIDVRLANCIKALEQVVIPSLPPGERMAREQALLVIGHLKMIGGQWKHALRFETASLDAMADLARAIAVSDPGFNGELTTALAATETIDRRDIDAVEAAVGRVGTAIDHAILGEEGTQPLSPAAIDAILAYGERQAFRERTWFKLCGLDPDAGELPAIEAVV
ncbi:hypothetical protein [Novosphingobium lentum]|uniref:hypothetical protein n=1 Tax=Novosphingobium lentum TaxID=145287 RepID=UPI0008302650|nr:hypothetical protein [Novosphingobium lentum]